MHSSDTQCLLFCTSRVQSCSTCMATSRGGQRFVTVGLPLIMLTVGGWLGIAHVLSGKFELKVHAML